MHQFSKSGLDRDSSDEEVPRKQRRRSFSSSSSHATNEKRYQVDLIAQNRFANDITICGVPVKPKEDLRDMVMRLCKNLYIHISPRDILSVYRNKKSLIVVQFANRRARDDVFTQSHTKSMYTDDIIRLASGESRARIYITYHVTEHYNAMLTLARQSYKDKMINHYSISNRGFGIRSSSQAPMKYFLSADELEDYIDELYTSNSVWLRRASSQSR